MRTLLSWLSLGTLALAGLPAPAGAQPVGSEFQINTRTTDSQFGPDVASDANGNFVVVWVTRYRVDLDDEISGQRFDSAGGMLGSEFQVNTFTESFQHSPSVAVAPVGDFVVAWESNGQDGFGTGVFAQRYDSGGNTLGGEFRVNSFTLLSQGGPAVATDSTGNFVVVWAGTSPYGGSGSEISGQRYDSAGVPLGGQFPVNSYTTSSQNFPAVAMDPSGGFVVVWQSRPQDGDLFGIFGQRFDSGGNRRGAEFSVNTYTTNHQMNASVAGVLGGGFVVVWNSEGQDGSSDGVFARRYDNAGNAQGPEFRVNTYTTGSQLGSSIASDASGGFVVGWSSPQDGDDLGAFGQRFDSGGVAQGDEFQINSYTTGVQGGPRIRTTNINEFVIAWFSDDQDGDQGGIFGQRFNFAGDTITVVSPNIKVKWPIGSMQRIEWTHNLGAAATFRIELDRDDDGEYEELIADEAPVDSATKGSFGWIVTGPRSGTARVRVSWTDDPGISDSSDVTFQIRPVGLD